MSVVKPTIDDLLSVTDENRFLLCEIAARRARDVNDMMRNQHNRAEQLADVEDISQFMSDEEGHAPNPLSIAFDEIAPRVDDQGRTHPGILSFDARSLHDELGLDDVDFACAGYADDDGTPVDEDAAESAEASDDRMLETPDDSRGASAESDADDDPLAGISDLLA